MPRNSKKSELIKNLCIKYSLDLLQAESSDDEEIMENFNMEMICLIQNRRTSHYHVPRSINWRSTVLHYLDEGRMRQMLRVDSKEFSHILSLIADDSVFENKNNVPQLPINHQLEIVLYRLGCSGEGATLKKCAALFGIGDGGTIQIISKRVFTALINLKSKFLFWPSERERLHLQQITSTELPGCMGYIDGTEFRLAEAPATNHELFYSRKRQYALKMQVICDHSLRIRHVTIGSPGSVHDAKIFANSTISREPNRFFSGSQWIAGDSAYPQKPFLVTPFRTNSSEFTIEQRENFNKYFSKYRVRVENCFGLLKETFGSLKELRFRYHKGINNSECNNWIMACCILHNILIAMKNPFFDMDSDIIADCGVFSLSSEQNLRTYLLNFINTNTN